MGLTRRDLLAGAAVIGASAAAASSETIPAPPRLRPTSPTAVPTEVVLSEAAPTGRVGCVLIDTVSGEILDSHQAEERFIPASVAKIPTALFALDRLGPSHQFKTRTALGRDGALYLIGGGDPTLDTAQLAELAAATAERLGDAAPAAFYYDEAALPLMARIDTGQPEYAAYNPGMAGLNLNFNRVQIRWEPKDGAAALSVLAHSDRKTIGAPNIAVTPAAEGVGASEVFVPAEAETGMEAWRVKASSLSGTGRRWLPVRDPGRYAAETFKALLDAARPEDADPIPAPQSRTYSGRGQVLATVESAPVSELLPGMLKFSTNLTAEALGVSAARRQGAGRSVRQSAEAMRDWLRAQAPDGDWTGLELANHSGLTVESRMTPLHAARIARLGALLHDEVFWRALPRARENLRFPPSAGSPPSHTVRAKSGTMYYARGLAGLLRVGGRDLAFGIFCTDYDKRREMDLAFDPNREGRPRGARSWLNRARYAERAVLGNWVAGQG